MSRIVGRALVVLAACVFARGAVARPVALLLDDAQPATRASAASGVAGLGGRVVHAFDGLLVVELPPGTEFRALKLAGVREVALNAVAPRASRAVPAGSLAAWNEIARGPSAGSGRPTDEPEFAEPDALVPPAVTLDAVRAASRWGGADLHGAKALPRVAGSTASGSPYGATDLNTSEFLAGSVTINLIVVESDGSHEPSSENWSADRESAVVARVAAGLEWVRLQEPQAELSFVYHVVSGRVSAVARTGYEPIRRAADPTGITGEDLWAKEVLGKMGYTTGDRFARSRALAADSRRADGTDWAVNVFVVDSLNDVDGKFADGRFAYTWIGGPHVVMTYDNQAWGIDRMDMVFRHELLHAFYAYDEYAASACACADHRGYLDGANANCTGCNVAADACVMIANGDALCAPTRRQIGWADLDGDGVIDVVGEDPDTFLDAPASSACAAAPVAGLATVVAATNRNPYTGTPRSSISVNRIAAVEVRADGAPWTSADPEDGAWGSAQERFRATLPSLSPGVHRVEARAVDDHGNVDAAPAAADVLVGSGSAPMGSTVRALRSPAGGAIVSWGACAGASSYRVYRAATPAAAALPLGETAGTSWQDDATTSGYYQVRPVDACGVERTD